MGTLTRAFELGLHICYVFLIENYLQQGCVIRALPQPAAR